MLPGDATKSSIGQGKLFAANKGDSAYQLLIGQQDRSVDWIISQSPSDNTAYRIYYVDDRQVEHQWSLPGGTQSMVVLRRGRQSYDWRFHISLTSPPSTGPRTTTGPGTTASGTTGPRTTTGPGPGTTNPRTTTGPGTTDPQTTTGPGTTGPGTTGPGTTGPGTTGPGTTGPGTTGPGTTGPGTTGPGTTGPGTTGPGTTGPGTTGPGTTTGSGTTGSGTTYRPWSYTTGPGTTGPGTTGSGTYRPWSHTTGPGTTGSKTTGSKTTGSKTTGSKTTGQKQTWEIADDVITNIRIVTYNAARDSIPDEITVQESIKALPKRLTAPKYLALKGEQPWSTRRMRIAENLLSYKIDIACFQATTIRQVRDLLELFGNDWAWVGRSTNGKNEGLLNPIFYRKRVFKPLLRKTFWLSDDPFEPSKTPSASAFAFRVCTVVRFSSIHSGKRFTILNTHLDHVSNDQRRLGASMLLVRARYEAVNFGPVFVAGTFNSPTTGDDSDAYKIVTGSIAPASVPPAFANKYAVKFDRLPKFRMVDLRAVTPKRHVSVNYATCTNFTDPDDHTQWRRISYILGGNNMGWRSGRYFVGTSLSDDGVLSSFHRPVFADISIR